MTHRALQQRGFTLIEVLLAMAITAFIAMLAYSGLSAAINASESQQKQVEALANIHLGLAVLERDIRQFVPRAIVDEYGDRQPPLLGGSQQEYPLQLTRAGWDNVREQRRSELQRVRYQLEDDKLWRENWRVLDRLDSEEGLQRLVLLKGVTAFELSFLDAGSDSAGENPLGGEWVDDWSPEEGVVVPPRAVQVELEIENFGTLRRVFELLPGGVEL